LSARPSPSRAPSARFGTDLIGQETIWDFYITIRTLDQMIDVSEKPSPFHPVDKNA
jgi:hypothetical protein